MFRTFSEIYSLCKIYIPRINDIHDSVGIPNVYNNISIKHQQHQK